MNFRLVNETSSIDEALSGRVPPGSDLLYELDNSKVKISERLKNINNTYI